MLLGDSHSQAHSNTPRQTAAKKLAILGGEDVLGCADICYHPCVLFLSVCALQETSF